MKNILRALVSAGFALALNACASDVDVPSTADAGMQPADGGSQPPPVDSGMTVVCGERLVLCGRTCVNLTQDGNNCGGCGRVCGGGTVCVDSDCRSTTPADAGTQPPPVDSGVTPPPADAGTTPPAFDEWRLIYRTASGDRANAIQSIEVWDGSARECTLNYLDPAQSGAPLTHTERCPTMRFARGATLHFNARFTLPATPATAPMPLETWSCHVAVRGGPMLQYGSVEAYRNGQRVQLRAVDNGRMGCNWVPAS